MGVLGFIMRASAVLVAVFAIFVGSLVADVPGKLGVWRYLDSRPYWKGATPFLHEGPWHFNFTTLGPHALDGRTFLVTGANVGLGYGTVHYLATHGGRVILGCRSMKNCQEAVRKLKAEAPNAELIPLVLDLSSFKSIKQFATDVNRTTSELHSLIMNAGFGYQPFHLTEDGIEATIGVNHFGHAYLGQLLEGLLKQTATKELPATVVVVSSGAHWSTYPEGLRLSLAAINDPSTFDQHQAYGQSKLANIFYARELAARLKPFNILVNSIHPGFVETNIAAKFEELLPNFPRIAKWLRELVFSISWDLYTGALTQVYAAVSPEILSNHITGEYYHPVARKTPVDPTYLSNATMQKQFWELTEQVVQKRANRIK